MQKKFETLLEEFRRYSGVNPTGLSLERCLSVYTAVNNMEVAGKRLKYTFQNIGLAVEALPKDMRCAHGTLKNNKDVEAFVNYIVETMSGSIEKRSLIEDIQRLKEENERLKLEQASNMVNIMEVEDLRVQLEQAMEAKERYKYLFTLANNRLHEVNDFSLDILVESPTEPNLIALNDGTLVDTSTGEIK